MAPKPIYVYEHDRDILILRAGGEKNVKDVVRNLILLSNECSAQLFKLKSWEAAAAGCQLPKSKSSEPRKTKSNSG
jgi:hypothetical protein